MNIIFISPECFPFVKVTPLADLVCSLSKGIESLGHNIKVFLPRYGSIDPSISQIERLPLELKINFNGSLTPTFVYKGILPNSLVSAFLIESQTHFSNSKEVYLANSQNEERFKYFAQAALETITKLKLDLTIIHLFAPHTTYIAKLLRSKSLEYAHLSKTPIVFTIYESSGTKETLTKTLKEAIALSSFITCTSKTHAHELLSDTNDFELKEIVAQKKDGFYGIESSIDEDIYNPETDDSIAQNYSKSYFSIGKRKCKEHLIEKTGLEKNLQIPLFGIISTSLDKEELDILTGLFPQVNHLNIQFVILVKGKELYEQELINICNKYKRIKVINNYDQLLSKKIFSGSDFFINLSKYEPSGIPLLIAMKYGSIPIAYDVRATKEIVIDVEVQEEANGIIFKAFKKEDLIEAINKAIKYYKNKEKWPRLVKQAMSFDSSRLKMAKTYLNLYELIGRDVAYNVSK